MQFNLCISHAGQPHGCRGCSRASGDHGQHAGLCGVSVWEHIGARASDGVCADGKCCSVLETVQDPHVFNRHAHTYLQNQRSRGQTDTESIKTKSLSNDFRQHRVWSGNSVHKRSALFEMEPLVNHYLFMMMCTAIEMQKKALLSFSLLVWV